MTRLWTDPEIEILRDRYPNERTADLARALGRTVAQTYSKAAYLGLKKTLSYLNGPDAGRLQRGDNAGINPRFTPGQTSWNKGLKEVITGGIETQFKPGNRSGKAALIYRPIGSERISKDGYLERKINDDLPMQRRWRAVHIIEWEAVNGPLPRGHALVFIDGDKRNIRLDNLELITRADLMRRNTYHQYGKEIAQLVHLRGRITQQINRRQSHV